MAASIEEMRMRKAPRYDLGDSFGDLDSEYEEDEAVHPLDSEESRTLLRKLQEWWAEARQMHAENRFQQSLDADFYDGFQWKDEDVEILKERGQAPLVFNVIRQHVNWILGTERRTRVDFRVAPRTNDDVEDALTKTKLLKYVTDVNHGQHHRSRAFEDSTKVGVGWLEDGIRSDPTKEPLFSRRENWRHIWWDALADEPDLSDARYLFRVKWVDTDIAEKMFPERAAQVRQSARLDELTFFEEDDEYNFIRSTGEHNGHPLFASGASFLDVNLQIGNRRSRNKLIECWHREPVSVKKIRAVRHAAMSNKTLQYLDGVDGTDYDETDPLQTMLIGNSMVSVFDAVEMKVFCAIWCGNDLLQNMPSPYLHNRFPFTPIWCYRRDRDGLPYGVVRGMRDPQEDLNKRRSKALFILSTNQIIGDEDAFEDWDEAADEAARPDGVLKHKRGATFEIRRETELAKEQVQLMEQDIQFLQSTSGVTEENRGEVTNTNSGAAINLRQNQGSVVTAVIFDNLARSIQCQGEIELSLCEQFYTEPKVIRLTSESGRDDFTTINEGIEDESGEFSVKNHIARTKADFIVQTQDFRESVRMAMFDSMMELMTRLDPEVVMQMLDLIMELYDGPFKTEIVRRIRTINGHIDPNDPKREELEQARADKKDEEAKLERRAREAEIRKNESVAEKQMADAVQSRGDTTRQATEIAAMLAGDTNLARAVDIMVDAFRRADDDAAATTTMAGAPGQTMPIPSSFPDETEGDSPQP